ncbi:MULTISPECIES: hypothetical protein [Actinoalloteichus]|uniref:Uncharacterized protein n=1 Tax=Actinoalloteichus fjordicus TaxID=1612552 RepID=A0AAC9LDW9_9PSEU|nr:MULTISPECIES: hypothetical protein [Actinoalloteichus]APU15084.1 hypothetical protein UA74_15155 [Actinoalloteichus fjordicus]APU21153.1 hypothetical protein UA75_15720 [Actinoalloteichus sp. GBA129-24]
MIGFPGGLRPRPDAACTCEPAWLALAVRLEDGTLIDVLPAATPGGLACLYAACCTRCAARYPHPFRVAPRTHAA